MATAAIRAGIPYLDVTAEQVTALRMFERLDELARREAVTVLPAMAFYGGLAVLLVSAIAPHRADAIEVAVGLDSWHPTEGTRRTGERNTFERVIVQEGELKTVPSLPPSRTWAFPAPLGEQTVTCVPLSEIILISRHLEAASVTSYMNLQPLEDLRGDRKPEAVDRSGRSAQRFVMDVRATIDGREARALASGQDIYAATAPLVVNACLTLLRQDAPPHGVLATGEVFDPYDFLRSLAPEVDVLLEPPTPTTVS